jgi:hypothetical protein
MILSAVRSAAFAVVAAAIVLVPACGQRSSSDGAGAGPDASVQNATGTVGADLTLPGGEHLSTVSYTLTNGANTYTGTVDVSGLSTATFVVGNVTSGDGYLLKLNAVTDDTSVACTGTSAPFSVSDRATTMVLVQLVCIATRDAGGVVVGGNPVNCAVWNTIVANPSTAASGGSLMLNAAATAPSPGEITFTWTVTSGTGTISNNTSAITQNDAGATDMATFTCPATGSEVDTIQLVVGDGPLPDGGSCPIVDTTGTVQVTCGGAPCVGVGTGTMATPNTATGTCPSGQVNTGTLKDGNGDYCCSIASGPCLLGTGAIATPDTATGACPTGQVNTGTLKDSNGNYCCSLPCSQSTLVPCTAANQTCCVACGGSANGLCTATEALLVAHDIANAKVTPDAGEGPGACYACLWNAGCLDDTNFHDTNQECGDLTGNFGVGPAAGSAASTLCLDTLSCILRTSCAATGGAGGGCYCGMSLGAGTCGTAPNGPCVIQESDGLMTPPIPSFSDPTTPSGRANTILTCAVTNNCTSCLTNGSGVNPGCPPALTIATLDITVSTPGGSTTITVSASGPPNLTAVWSTSAGTLSNEHQSGSTLAATFTCPAAAATVPVTVVVNGGPTASCPTTDNTLTATVHCPGPVVCDASALAPCTAAGQSCCVPCAGSANGVCTPTEALLVARDIANGHATQMGDAQDGCYTCLFNGGCIDDVTFGDSGHECGDLPNIAFNAGAQAGTLEPLLCQQTLSCLLAPPSCASQAVSACYCGTAGVATACQGNPAPGPINGTCATQIAAGLGFPPSDGTDITKHLTDTTLPAGVADQIFQCALTNMCTTCMH